MIWFGGVHLIKRLGLKIFAMKIKNGIRRVLIIASLIQIIRLRVIGDILGLGFILQVRHICIRCLMLSSLA